MTILRDLAELMKEAAKYLDRGTDFDRAWAEHLRKDRLDIVNMAQTDRHMNPVPKP